MGIEWKSFGIFNQDASKDGCFASLTLVTGIRLTKRNNYHHKRKTRFNKKLLSTPTSEIFRSRFEKIE